MRFSVTGRHPQKTIQRLRNRYGGEYCDVCREARDRGAYVFACTSCGDFVSGGFKDVSGLLNVVGHRLCHACFKGLWGVFDLGNPAVAALVRARPGARTVANRRRRRHVLRAEWVAYAKHVRQASKVTWRQHAAHLNTQARLIGPSGVPGVYQLDHVVPVRHCWEHGIDVSDAVAASNLQVIPWRLNGLRTRHFRLEHMVGYPGAYAPPTCEAPQSEPHWGIWAAISARRAES